MLRRFFLWCAEKEEVKSDEDEDVDEEEDDEET